MIQLRKSSILIFLILAAILAACNATPTPNPTSAPTQASTAAQPAPATQTLAATGQPTLATGSAGCTNAYFPLTSGATWTYDSTGSVLGSYTYTRTLSDLTHTGFTTVDTFSTGTVRTVKWKCANGNLTSLAAGSDNGSVSTGPTSMTITSLDSTGYVVPSAFIQGTTWGEDVTAKGTLSQGAAQTGSAVLEDETTCAMTGTESVQVTAGTFSAIKVTCHTNLVTTITLGGITQTPVTTVQDATEWYAKGVGVVKTINMSSGGTETIQLTKVSIP